jgi:hypothetical protein
VQRFPRNHYGLLLQLFSGEQIESFAAFPVFMELDKTPKFPLWSEYPTFEKLASIVT